MSLTPITEVALPKSKVQVVWSVIQVAKHCGLSKTVIYEDIAAGKLVAHKRGQRTLVFDDDFSNYLSSMRPYLTEVA